jgi:pyruvate formate lyase activating enzyme
LHADFICRFREICVEDWKITLETALNVPLENLKTAAAVSDAFIVDIKDCNDAIYQLYTGKSNHLSLSNLEWLLQNAGAERITVRVPLIPDFNTEEDRQRSVEQLQSMGVKQLDLFTYKVSK